MRRYEPETVKDVVLGYLGRGGYMLPTNESGEEPPIGDLVILHGRGHRAVARFEFGVSPGKLDASVVEEFSNQKESLQATAAFLITDGELSDAARERVEEAGATVIAGQSLENLILAYRGSTWPPLRKQEEPLPFQKYIPWFVGISLVLIVAIVLALISAELTLRPPNLGG